MQPPIVTGSWPVIGHLPEFVRDKAKLFQRGYREQGDIFTVKVPSPMVVVTGPERHRWFYRETDKGLDVEKAYEILKYALGEVLLTASEAKYRVQHAFLHLIFSRERMVGYIEAMNAEVDRWLESLGDSGEMEILEELMRVSQSVAGHAFAGSTFREELGEGFWQAYLDIANSLNMIFPPNWPLPKYRRRDRARKAIRETLSAMCRTRGEAPDKYDDIIALLVNTELEDGTKMDYIEVADLWVGMMFAGHDTTARQAAWSVILTLQHPEIRTRLEEEVSAVDGDLDATSLRNIPLTYQVLDEVTRLKPSADMLLRVAKEDVPIDDYVIPKGWRVVTAAGSSHFLTSEFENPDIFDPDRFGKDRNEGKRSAIMGFGGGRRKCAGMNFAKNEMAIIMAKLFRDYELTLLTPETKTTQAMAGPPRPTPTYIAYRRRRG